MNSDIDPELQKHINEVMRGLPLPIRCYLSEGKYSRVAQRLTGKYSLHIDQGGILERELMLLLMGIESPDEFAASLKSEGQISEDTVFAIMTDVNQEVFVPLQGQMHMDETSGEMPEARGSSIQPASARLVTTAPSVLQPQQLQPQSVPSPPAIAMPSVAPSPDIAPLPPKHALPPFSSDVSQRPAAFEPPANLPGVQGSPSRAVPAQPVSGAQFTPLASVNPLASTQPSASVPVQTGPVSPSPIESYPVDPYRETPE